MGIGNRDSGGHHTAKGPLQSTEEGPASSPLISTLGREQVVVDHVPQPGV
jgi:hypothetical protein